MTRVLGDITLTFLFVPCLFTGENTEEGLPDSSLFLLVAFYNSLDNILAAHRTDNALELIQTSFINYITNL